MLGGVSVLSGLALWKPVQLQGLAALLGGYEVSRRIHFLAMAGIGIFGVVHLSLVALVPRPLLGMLTGPTNVRLAGSEASR
jgi:thiosulfate reductase cytochrome b subunit